MSVDAVAVGAPKNAYSAIKGYFYMLPITATPPANAYSALPESKVNVGYVGEEGPSLTAELDTDMVRDWNLDDTLQVKNGASASLEVPVYGWGVDQARVVYGTRSVVTTANGFKVVWSGELPAHVWLVLELRGKNGDARLVCDAQIGSPGQVQFATNQALSHTVTATLFKNEAFKDVEGANSYFALYDEADPADGGLAPTITTTSLGTLTSGQPYSIELQATGTAPITWAVSAGTLPTGLTLYGATGIISGTPTDPASTAYDFTVSATNSAGSDTQQYTGTIA